MCMYMPSSCQRPEEDIRSLELQRLSMDGYMGAGIWIQVLCKNTKCLNNLSSQDPPCPVCAHTQVHAHATVEVREHPTGVN